MKEFDATLMWSLSEKCNLNCDYCFNQERAHGEIKEIFIEKLLKTLKRSKKRYLIILSGGGEPFLVKNFIELCEKLTKYYYVSVITNLTSNNIEEFAKKISPSRIDNFVVSMHLKELSHKGLMGKFISNLNVLQKRGYNLMVTEVAYPGLINGFKKYDKFIKQINCKLEFLPFFGDYKQKHYPESYTDKELNFFGLKNNPKYSRIFQYNKLCNAGYNLAYVKPNGDIDICPWIPIKLGNIYEKINFRKSMVNCPVKFCSCPLNDSDYTHLFNKAINKTRFRVPLFMIDKCNFLEKVFISLDYKIGVFGTILQKNYPQLYSLLKSIKNN
ncbi:7-carboxy-7-deazaguanine synthase [uncultured archaeon]|nr:7-carboxy-7-deazaguanine synthase [uncultured archaeon]